MKESILAGIFKRFKKSIQAVYHGRYWFYRKKGFIPIRITDTYYKIATRKGKKYYVDLETNSCTCPGFFYVKKCRHMDAIGDDS